MPSIRTQENIGKLTKTSSTTVQLPAGSRINIGGMQYINGTALSMSTGSVGVGGLDAALTVSSVYYVYAIVSSGNMALIGSKNSSLPSGYTQARQVGVFTTDAAGLIAIVSVTGLDDATATMLGLKTYFADQAGYPNDIAYNGGYKATLSLSGWSFDNSVNPPGGVIRAILIPRQMQDGTWRLEFSMRFNTIAPNVNKIIVANTVFKNITTNWRQYVGGVDKSGGQILNCDVKENTGEIIISGTNNGAPALYGDVELNSKPLWAY